MKSLFAPVCRWTLFDPDIQWVNCTGVSCLLASNGMCSFQPLTKLRTHQILQFFLNFLNTVTLHMSVNRKPSASSASDSTQNLPETLVLSNISPPVSPFSFFLCTFMKSRATPTISGLVEMFSANVSSTLPLCLSIDFVRNRCTSEIRFMSLSEPTGTIHLCH